MANSPRQVYVPGGGVKTIGENKGSSNSGMINTRRKSGKRGERESMFPSPMKTPGKR